MSGSVRGAGRKGIPYRDFEVHFFEHFRGQFSGFYQFYEPNSLSKIEKVCLWGGKYDKSSKFSTPLFMSGVRSSHLQLWELQSLQILVSINRRKEAIATEN